MRNGFRGKRVNFTLLEVVLVFALVTLLFTIVSMGGWRTWMLWQEERMVQVAQKRLSLAPRLAFWRECDLFCTLTCDEKGVKLAFDKPFDLTAPQARWLTAPISLPGMTMLAHKGTATQALSLQFPSRYFSAEELMVEGKKSYLLELEGVRPMDARNLVK